MDACTSPLVEDLVEGDSVIRGKRNGLAKQIWLYIVKEGGRWTPEEIADQFGVPRQIAALAMHNMTSRTGALLRVKVRGRAKFGVTQACTIPHGVRLNELLEVRQ